MVTEYIDFEELRSRLEINDYHLFQEYLIEIYKDLLTRPESDADKGISKITFWEYLKMPVFIAEKLFVSLDINNDGYLNLDEFVMGLYKLYVGTFEETCDIIFNFLDFDKDKMIESGDTKMLLSFLPLEQLHAVSKSDKIDYMNQMEGLNEIGEIISQTFNGEKKLNREQFNFIVQNRKSDIYLQFICFFYLNKPFSKFNLEMIRDIKRKVILTQSPIEEEVERRKVRLPSPNKKSKLSPVHKYLRNKNSNNHNSDDESKKEKKKQSSKFQRRPLKSKTQMNISSFSHLIRMTNTIQLEPEYLKNVDDIKFALSKDCLSSPMKYLNKASNHDKVTINMIQMKEEDEDALERETEKENIIQEGWLSRFNDGNLTKYWSVIIGKDIFYYMDNNKSELIGVQNLSGSFIKENQNYTDAYFSFSLLFSSKVEDYFTQTLEDQQVWLKAFRKSIGYENLFDHYNIIEDIGEGKFGMVKLGIHIKTNEKVAIKILSKIQMDQSDFELVKFEIDIMKLCKHENVVRLIDHYENSDYIFIIMEYLGGGDLENYCRKRNFELDEMTISNIIFQVVSGVKYIHQFGIIHRDIKPENILLVNSSDPPLVKVMDFGLSKILGPKERALEAYGTLSYVAPEILLRKPYNKQIDVWSIGIVLYYMSSGALPFDDPCDDQAVIARKTAYDKLRFPLELFDCRSIELIELITQCLIKDPNKRITIKEFLSHDWIRNLN